MGMYQYHHDGPTRDHALSIDSRVGKGAIDISDERQPLLYHYCSNEPIKTMHMHPKVDKK